MKFNSKKTAAILAVVGLLGLGSSVNATTSAKFTKEFKGSVSFKANSFNVNSDLEARSQSISFGEEVVAPGSGAKNMVSFKVNKDTPLGTSFNVQLIPSGDLFENKGPLKFTVSTNNGKFVDFKYDEKTGTYVSEDKIVNDTKGEVKFIINWRWPSDNHLNGIDDNFYMGKSGDVQVVLNAVQNTK